MIGSAATSKRLMVGSSICSRQPLANGRDLLAHFGGGGLRIDLEPQLDADARQALGRASRSTRLTPLMPATASSIGRVTSVSTSSGPAPGIRRR